MSRLSDWWQNRQNARVSTDGMYNQPGLPQPVRLIIGLLVLIFIGWLVITGVRAVFHQINRADKTTNPTPSPSPTPKAPVNPPEAKPTPAPSPTTPTPTSPTPSNPPAPTTPSPANPTQVSPPATLPRSGPSDE